MVPVSIRHRSDAKDLLWPPFALKRIVWESHLNCDRTFAVSLLPEKGCSLANEIEVEQSLLLVLLDLFIDVLIPTTEPLDVCRRTNLLVMFEE